METNLFDYSLPSVLIAQQPASPRDHSRLLVYNRKTNKIIHDHFYNLTKYLTSNDVLVFNDTKVFPARLIGQKLTGGKAEILLLKKLENGIWEGLVGTNNPKIGSKLRFPADLTAKLIKRLSDKSWAIKFNFSGLKFQTVLNKIGQTPLPPYIKSDFKDQTSRQLDNQITRQQYQTIYAKNIGSVAAPTAGFHFTKRLLNKIKQNGCQIEFVTLHVGLGTFEPVNTENIEDYKIHKEWASVRENVIKRLLKAKQGGKRIVAVGTTSARVLETIFNDSPIVRTMGLRKFCFFNSFSDYINLFIYPGYKFKFINALITNFHLPKSTLLMLVSAFIGRKNILEIYKKAIKLKYRFYSFGDGMLLT